MHEKLHGRYFFLLFVKIMRMNFSHEMWYPKEKQRRKSYVYGGDI